LNLLQFVRVAGNFGYGRLQSTETRGRSPVSRIVFGRLFRGGQFVPGVDGDQVERRNGSERDRYVRGTRPERYGNPDVVILRPGFAGHVFVHEIVSGQNRFGKRQTRLRVVKICIHGENYEFKYREVLELYRPLSKRQCSITRSTGKMFTIFS